MSAIRTYRFDYKQNKKEKVEHCLLDLFEHLELCICRKFGKMSRLCLFRGCDQITKTLHRRVIKIYLLQDYKDNQTTKYIGYYEDQDKRDIIQSTFKVEPWATLR